jgi:hypothetical protein
MEYGRYRNRSTPNLNGLHQVRVDGSLVTNASKVLPSFESVQTYDTEIARFRRRSAAGEIFNNPFLSSKTEVIISDVANLAHRSYNSSGAVTYSEDHLWDRFQINDQLNSWSLPEVSLSGLDDAVRNAQIAALANVNATDVNVLAFAGEWSKTKNLHRDIGNALLDLFTKGARAHTTRDRVVKTALFDEKGRPLLNRRGEPIFRYGHTGGSVSVSGESLNKRMANVYLVGRYGVMPLLSDLEGACKNLMRKWNPRFTARGNASVQGQSSSVKAVSAGYYGTYDLLAVVTRTYDIRYGLLYESDPYTRELAQLGLTRPLSAAWELMPWSFVADWFVGVGRYLDAIQPAGLTKTLSAWGSTRETIVTAIQPSVYHPYVGVPSGTTWSWSWNGAFLRTNVVKRRDPWDAAIPSHPGLGSGFNAMRSGDFAALMLQRIRAKF